MDNKELKMNEMEEISGGAAGSRDPLPEKAGCKQYKIISGDNLTKIANKFQTTVDYLMFINKGIITDRDFIRAGYYMYVPA